MSAKSVNNTLHPMGGMNFLTSGQGILMEDKINVQVNLFAKQKQRHRHREQTHGHQVGKMEWEELGSTNIHYSVSNRQLMRNYYIAQGTLLNALW